MTPEPAIDGIPAAQTDDVHHNRRHFLRLIAAGSGALALEPLLGRLARADVREIRSPYGPLSPRLDVERTRLVLSLPPDFQYRILSSAGDLMSDAIATPTYCDGMAAFEDPDGNIRLVRNHEFFSSRSRPLNVDAPRYDTHGGGGTTTLVIDPATRTLIRDFVSLNGTVANCSGGKTPWGTWLSCEETILGPADGFEKPHGYIFEVSPLNETLGEPQPLTAMGRFAHEAVAIDETTGIAYLTEDRATAGFYRFVPNVPGQLAAGGRLQCLAIVGAPDYDTRKGQRAGVSLPVTWVDIPQPDADPTTAEPQPVYRQGRERGAARFARPEGAAIVDGNVYFTATTGGDRALGQIWRYRPFTPGGAFRRRAARPDSSAPEAAGELTLLVESDSEETLKAPDNLTISPRGSLLICEDHALGYQRIRALTPDGRLFDFAVNVLRGFEHAELAGVTFSPDGETLFLNFYDPGMTLAIWGPFSRGPI